MNIAVISANCSMIAAGVSVDGKIEEFIAFFGVPAEIIRPTVQVIGWSGADIDSREKTKYLDCSLFKSKD